MTRLLLLAKVLDLCGGIYHNFLGFISFVLCTTGRVTSQLPVPV